MKIKVFCSVTAVVVMTIAFASMEPPSRQAVAQSSPVEAVQQPKKEEATNLPAQTEKAITASDVKPDEQKQVAPAVETKPAPRAPLTDRQQLMQSAGIAESDWPATEDIINRESGWCHTKWEGEWGVCLDYHGVPDSGGYGLCQSTPAHKMASMGADWATNPVTQLKWCNEYVKAYGGWTAAKAFRDCLGECFSPRTQNVQFKKTTWF